MSQPVTVERHELHTLLAAAFLYLHTTDHVAMPSEVRQARQDVETILAKYSGVKGSQRPGQGADHMNPLDNDTGPDCRRCGKPTGKWWLSGAGIEAYDRMLCPVCDAADTARRFALPVCPDEEPTT